MISKKQRNGSDQYKENLFPYEFKSLIAGKTVVSNQNSQAVKKGKGYGEKRCEIQSGSQEMAVIVG